MSRGFVKEDDAQTPPIIPPRAAPRMAGRFGGEAHFSYLISPKRLPAAEAFKQQLTGSAAGALPYRVPARETTPSTGWCRPGTPGN